MAEVTAMKRCMAWVAVTAIFCGTMTAEKPEKPRSEDYSLIVHVVASRTVSNIQTLEAEAEGRRVVMESQVSGIIGVLLPGDYRARLIPKDSAQLQAANGYETFLQYEFLLPDGKTRRYWVYSICTAEAKTCAHP